MITTDDEFLIVLERYNTLRSDRTDLFYRGTGELPKALYDRYMVSMQQRILEHLHALRDYERTHQCVICRQCRGVWLRDIPQDYDTAMPDMYIECRFCGYQRAGVHSH